MVLSNTILLNFIVMQGCFKYVSFWRSTQFSCLHVLSCFPLNVRPPSAISVDAVLNSNILFLNSPLTVGCQ